MTGPDPRSAARRSRPWLALVLALLWAALALWPRAAFAHQVGMSSGRYVSDGADVTITLGIRRPELLGVAPAFDANGDRLLTDAELVVTDAAAAQVVSQIKAERGGAACVGVLENVAKDSDDGAVLSLRYAACAGEGVELVVAVGGLVSAAGSGHRHAVIVEGPGLDKPRDDLVFGAGATVRVPLDPSAPSVSGPAPGRLRVLKEYFVIGVEHIWFGVDHVVFLLGLVLLGGQLKHLVTTITAFTVSHSVTIALAVLGVIAPQPEIVEPIIALSVAYVGVENFLVKDLHNRWRVAGAFGLIHGFGFAGALGKLEVPQESVPYALAAFNVGVEIGQLVLLLLIVPALRWLHKQSWYQPKGMWVASGAIVLVGLGWFVERTLL